MVFKYIKSNQGFSLVELLITVVVAGVLAAVAVPKYKKMVGKAKAGEAKVLLGAVSTAESVFFTEYADYGNNIVIMGVEISSPKTYTTGFNSVAGPTCTTIATGATNFYPASPFPGYQNSGGSLAGKHIAGTVCPANTSYTASAGAYKAFASGNIKDDSSSCVLTGSGTKCDIWSINQAGTVALELSGDVN